MERIERVSREARKLKRESFTERYLQEGALKQNCVQDKFEYAPNTSSIAKAIPTK